MSLPLLVRIDLVDGGGDVLPEIVAAPRASVP
jgi:hypothetical protein